MGWKRVIPETEDRSLFSYWLERVHEAVKTRSKETGITPKWLILSYENWIRMEDAAKPHLCRMSAAELLLKQPPQLMGMRIAVTPGRPSVDDEDTLECV